MGILILNNIIPLSGLVVLMAALGYLKRLLKGCSAYT